jgi:hypothetical protein
VVPVERNKETKGEKQVVLCSKTKPSSLLTRELMGVLTLCPIPGVSTTLAVNKMGN